MSSNVSFKGKVVLVAGAGSSIVGAEVAKLLSKLGATLVLTDPHKERLNKVAKECTGVTPLVIAADLTSTEDVTTLINQTVNKHKKLDVLVNCGGSACGDIENGVHCSTTLEDYDRDMNMSRAFYHLTMLSAPHLIKSKGNVVNIYGSAPVQPSHHVLSYSVSKSALDELTRCLALQLAADGVRVNAITSTVDHAICCPIGRAGEAKDVADAVIFLASESASFIAGANLPVDGGAHLIRYQDGTLQVVSTHEAAENDPHDKPTGKSAPVKSEPNKQEPKKADTTKTEHKHDTTKVETKPENNNQSQGKASPKDANKNDTVKTTKH